MYKQTTITTTKSTNSNYKKQQSYVWVVAYGVYYFSLNTYKTFTNKVKALDFYYNIKSKGYEAKIYKDFAR